MNKMLVDKLPEACFNCPCFRFDEESCCYFDDGSKDYCVDYGQEPEGCTCPLQLIKDHDKEIIKSVVEKIIDKYNLNHEPRRMESGDISLGSVMINATHLKRFLNEILKLCEE